MIDINYYIYEELILNKLFNEGSYLSTILEQIAFSLYTNRDNKNYIEYAELSNIRLRYVYAIYPSLAKIN